MRLPGFRAIRLETNPVGGLIIEADININPDGLYIHVADVARYIQGYSQTTTLHALAADFLALPKEIQS